MFFITITQEKYMVDLNHQGKNMWYVGAYACNPADGIRFSNLITCCIVLCSRVTLLSCMLSPTIITSFMGENLPNL